MSMSGTKRSHKRETGGSGLIETEEPIATKAKTDEIKASDDAKAKTDDQHRMTKKDGHQNAEAKTDKPGNLDDFLREMFQTTTVGEEKGMPSIDWLKEHFKTKSAAIRYLHEKGHKVKDISKHLNLRYQHVRNVLTTELKRGPNESFRLDDYQSPNMKSTD